MPKRYLVIGSLMEYLAHWLWKYDGYKFYSGGYQYNV